MKGPTLIAEKPSFSRGPDGKYPFGVASFRETMTNLKNDTRSLSTKGDYSLADSSYKQIAVVRQQEKVHRKAEEHGRQREEKLNLDKAYKIEKERFEAAWAKNIEQVERECEEKLRILREVHAIALVDNEKEIAQRLAGMRYKASSQLLQLEDTERKLANLHEFKQAAEVSARAQRMRQREEAAFEKRKAHVDDRPRALCVQAQEAEMRNLLQKCHGLRVTVRREREQALEVFKQKYRNLEADLQHAHAIEFSLPAEIGAVQSHKSRSMQSSTFRGTLKYESLAGTKFDVPDVSRLAPM